jgi:hypothetical protein
MGDRFTFGVVDKDGDVLYLYSHWGGGDWDTNLKQALWEAGGQSNSCERANRIVMSWLIGDGWDSKSGYAFSINRPLDTDYGFIPVVDFLSNKVTFYEYDNGSLGHKLVELSIIKYLNNGGIIHEMLDWAMNEHNEVREILNVTL